MQITPSCIKFDVQTQLMSCIKFGIEMQITPCIKHSCTDTIHAFPCLQRSLFVQESEGEDLTLPQSMIVDESNQFVKQVLKPV